MILSTMVENHGEVTLMAGSLRPIAMEIMMMRHFLVAKTFIVEEMVVTTQ